MAVVDTGCRWTAVDCVMNIFSWLSCRDDVSLAGVRTSGPSKSQPPCVYKQTEEGNDTGGNRRYYTFHLIAFSYLQSNLDI